MKPVEMDRDVPLELHFKSDSDLEKALGVVDYGDAIFSVDDGKEKPAYFLDAEKVSAAQLEALKPFMTEAAMQAAAKLVQAADAGERLLAAAQDKAAGIVVRDGPRSDKDIVPLSPLWGRQPSGAYVMDGDKQKLSKSGQPIEMDKLESLRRELGQNGVLLRWHKSLDLQGVKGAFLLAAGEPDARFQETFKKHVGLDYQSPEHIANVVKDQASYAAERAARGQSVSAGQTQAAEAGGEKVVKMQRYVFDENTARLASKQNPETREKQINALANSDAERIRRHSGFMKAFYDGALAANRVREADQATKDAVRQGLGSTSQKGFDFISRHAAQQISAGQKVDVLSPLRRVEEMKEAVWATRQAQAQGMKAEGIAAHINKALDAFEGQREQRKAQARDAKGAAQAAG